MSQMKDRGKEPHSVGVLDSWIDHAESEFGVDRSGRVRWLVATTVVTAMLQMVVDESDTARFSLKGGSLLQHVLGLEARATQDLDGMVRGDLEDFVEKMDEVFLDKRWGPFQFRRSEIEPIRVPGKAALPLKFEVAVTLKSKTWRRIKVEISPEEGRAACSGEAFPAPKLEGFGIPTPDKLVGMAMSYQAAQKLHGAAGLHDPEHGYKNLRARDVVDAILIKRLSDETGHPSPVDIRRAAEDTFRVRGAEAQAAGRIPLTWPPKLQAYGHWRHDYHVAADAVGLELTLEEAVDTVNEWVALLAEAGD